VVKPLFALSVAFAAIFGQIIPGCDDKAQVVVGYVDQKDTHSDGTREWIIVVDRTHYNVPATFWARVQVGDRVRYDGRQWTITRRAGEPSDLVPIQILPTPTPNPTPRP